MAGALLLLADRARVDRAAASRYDLWRDARERSTSPDERRRMFRHAMVHAGYLLDPDGAPYAVCGICDAVLPAAAP